ncbi:MAG: hypothetical protein KAW47_11365, partial [Thermoplasmatales archaeon]|nr:hypothetical protein [Thermoplasmatales archaeon]
NEIAIRNSLWLLTDLEFKRAIKNYSMKIAKRKKEVKDRENIGDFTIEKPTVFNGQRVKINIDKEKWKEKLKLYSRIFTKYPDLEEAYINLNIDSRNVYFTNSEGSKIFYGSQRQRIIVSISTITDDGMEISNFVSFEGWKEEDFPADEKIMAEIKRISDELITMKKAKIIEPYSGPVLLKGEAAGVFFHEVFGHRIEAQRQKSKNEGQTFKNKVGEKMLPEFVSIYDDPSIRYYQNMPLFGSYPFDDEGIKTRKVTLVEDGILKKFLMSRMPIKGFNKSNGHGRLQIKRAARYDVVPRQGNLIIEAKEAVKEEELEARLIEECKKEGKPYGLIVTTTAGGATITGRFWIQSFVQIPVVIYRLYTDGRKEMIRGARFGGTPLASLEKILCFGDRSYTFNGYCGAESGYMPVSAVSPSVIISSLELAKEQNAKLKPPLLPSPFKDLKRSK